MEAGEYGLTRGTCFVARRLEVVAVAGLLCIWWCVLGAAEFISCFFFAKRRRLSVSNGRLCPGACEKFPGTFAYSVGLFIKTIISSLVCLLPVH